MKKTDRIRALILISLILTGVYVWVLTPAMTGPDLYYVARGTESPEGEEQRPSDREESSWQSDQPEMSQQLQSDMAAGYLVLVNKENGLGKNDKPEDLEAILYFAPDRSPEGRYLRAEAAAAFHRLIEEAAREGITLALTTGYRSYDFQSLLYNNYVKKDGQAAADRYSARPGKSEHQTGLAADVSGPSVDYKLVTELEDTREGKWLSENASRFGFILRYPKGKEALTGYMYEPWHIRYVGLTAANYIAEHGLTLEEYLELIQSDREE